MTSKNQFVVSVILKSALVFSPLLLCADISPVQATASTSQQQIVAQALTNKEREELTRLRAEKRDNTKIQADLEQRFNRTTILFNIWLVLLSLFPIAIIALFWLLRRVAIREIVNRAMSQFEGIEKLESQLVIVKQDAENLIQDVKSINRLLERETETLQQKIRLEQENLSIFTSELLQEKTDNFAQITAEITKFQSKIETLVVEFANKLSQSELDTQKQRDITLENIVKLESLLNHQLTEIQKEAEKHQQIALGNIDTAKVEFDNHLLNLQAEIQQQKNSLVDNITRWQLELQGDLQKEKDIQLGKIQELANAFNSQVAELQLVAQNDKNNLNDILHQWQSDAQLEKDRVLQSLEELRKLFQAQVSELQLQNGQELIQLQSEFASYLSELKTTAESNKERIIEKLEKSGTEFVSQFSELQSNTQQQILERIEKLEAEFVNQLFQLQLDAQQRKDAILQELAENQPAVVTEIQPIQEPQPEELTDETKQLEVRFDECIAQGDNLFSQKRYEEAIAYYEQAVKIQANDAVAWFKLGLTLAKLKRFKDAIKSYNQAIKIQPDYHQAWCDLGVAFGNIRRHKEAFAAFDKATQVKPDDGVAWLNRGLALIELEEYEDAIASFDKALQFPPNSPKIWDKRGYCLVRLGLDDEAIIAFDKALEIKSDYASAYYNKAACYALQREVNLALANLQQAIIINPRYKEDAATDIDFDEIADNKQFQQLISDSGELEVT
ncbi:tetratricopeptide repeat protein [Anabaena azotica]|uniref:Tetratricopeptide repeat protein n=1 Tax=Anabaena azotica FACHB-119 TaxID=947527 RepID=A0ABR8D9V0_9NOST|nr:tetratricopeptide repeat protein [Anabaena azotica]MBD2503090.1 tetratricopeptide repeat protein [Anabaena azotica FACHB-119]